jgi:hypothetical protein
MGFLVRHFGRSPVCDWQVIGPDEMLTPAFFMRLQANPAVSVPQRFPLGGVFFCLLGPPVEEDQGRASATGQCWPSFKGISAISAKTKSGLRRCSAATLA